MSSVKVLQLRYEYIEEIENLCKEIFLFKHLTNDLKDL